MTEYRCEARSVTGFVQQLAVGYVSRGYYRYVTGRIQRRKDPRVIDSRIIEKYGLAIGKTSRHRRKELGLANIQYLRYGRSFLILASAGAHPLFEKEAGIRDVREMPIKFAGYAISFRGGHVHVRIEQRRYLALKAKFLDLAVHRKKDWFEERFRRLPFEPYAPIRGQLFGILRKVNARREVAQFEPIARSCIRTVRRVVKPFGENPPQYPKSARGPKMNAAPPASPSHSG